MGGYVLSIVVYNKADRYTMSYSVMYIDCYTFHSLLDATIYWLQRYLRARSTWFRSSPRCVTPGQQSVFSP